MENALQAYDFETLIYSNIHNYDFKAMNIMVKAHVDFLDLYFEINRSSSRHDIKKYLTEKTGIKHYISEYGKGFIIRLHDMNSLKSCSVILCIYTTFNVRKKASILLNLRSP